MPHETSIADWRQIPKLLDGWKSRPKPPIGLGSASVRLKALLIQELQVQGRVVFSEEGSSDRPHRGRLRPRNECRCDR